MEQILHIKAWKPECCFLNGVFLGIVVCGFVTHVFFFLGVIAVSWYPPDLKDDNGEALDDIVPLLLEVAHKYHIKVRLRISSRFPGSLFLFVMSLKKRGENNVLHSVYALTGRFSHRAVQRER